MGDKQKSIHSFFGGKDPRDSESKKNPKIGTFFKSVPKDSKVAVKRPREPDANVVTKKKQPVRFLRVAVWNTVGTTCSCICTMLNDWACPS